MLQVNSSNGKFSYDGEVTRTASSKLKLKLVTFSASEIDSVLSYLTQHVLQRDAVIPCQRQQPNVIRATGVGCSLHSKKFQTTFKSLKYATH